MTVISQMTTMQRRLVLVADDEESIRLFISRVVTRLGLVALSASDGAEAIQIAETHRTELACAILDVGMPIMSGADAAHVIQRVAPDAAIVLMSGEIPSHCAERIKWLRLTGMLYKPFHLTALEELILHTVGDGYALEAEARA